MALRREDGTWLESKEWFACIRCDQGRHTALLEGVPSQKFTGIRFNVGLDAATDASDPCRREPRHPLHPLVNGLHCGSHAGYLFLALEGRYQKRDGTFGGYACHLAGNANLMRVELPLQVAATGAGTIRLAFDIEKLFHGPNPIRIGSDGASAHSTGGDQLAAPLKKNVEAAFRVKGVTADPSQNLAHNERRSASDSRAPTQEKTSGRTATIKVPFDHPGGAAAEAVMQRLYRPLLPQHRAVFVRRSRPRAAVEMSRAL